MKCDLFNDGIGSVEYVSHMGSDLTVVNAARVSFGAETNSLREKDIKLIALCNKLKANKYIANNKSENYINEDNFRRHNIKLEYQNYNLKKYSQFNDKKKLTYIPYLSIIDLIFNHGDQSNNYI